MMINCTISYSVCRSGNVSVEYANTTCLMPQSLSILRFSMLKNEEKHLCTITNYKKTKNVVLVAQTLQGNTGLQMLEISNSYLSAVVSKQIVTMISERTSIETVKVSNINVESFFVISSELAQTKSLKTFEISYVNISNNELIGNNIASVIVQNTHLQCITISNCNVYEDVMNQVAKAVEKASAVKCLSLDGNCITDAAASKLAASLAGKGELESINLSDCKLQASHLLLLMSSLQNATLKCIKLSKNCGVLEVTHFNEILNVLPISNLALSECELFEADFIGILEALLQKSTLQELDFSSNCITYAIAEKLVQVLQENNNIVSLNLSNCSLNERSVLALLTGLQHIISLKCIKMSYNGYSKEEKDLGGLLTSILDKNKSLEHVTLSETYCVTMTGAVSVLTSLKYLDLHSSVVSSSTLAGTIKNNINLQHLNIADCKMSESMLEVADSISSLSMLEYLNLSGHLMTEEIANIIAGVVNKNSQLKYFAISKCLIENNGLVRIFKALQCCKYLFHLDVSYTTINELAAFQLAETIKKSISLTFVGSNHCKYSKISFSKLLDSLHLKYLRHLFINNNSVWSGKYVNELVNVITGNEMLESLDLSKCNLPGQRLARIVTGLSKSSVLQNFDISHNEITDEAATAIASVITNNTSLKHMTMNDCNLKEDGLVKIARALTKITSLLSLDVSNNSIDETAAYEITVAICCNTALKHLHFSNCLSGNACLQILEIIQTMTTVKILDLECNSIDGAAADALSLGIANNSKIKHLNLSNCKLTEHGLIKLLSVLQNVVTLEYLNLKSNIIIAEQLVNLLATIIAKNTGLKHLNISDCKFSNPPLKMMLEALDKHSNLKYFNISYNIVDDGYEQLAHITSNNANLTTLILSHTGLNISKLFSIMAAGNAKFLKHLDISHVVCDEDDSNEVAKFLSNNIQIDHLAISGCTLLRNVVDSILLSVKEMNSVQYLNLASCCITSTSSKLLAITITNNHFLKYLDVSKCKLEPAEFIDIAKALQDSASLQYLILDCNNITSDIAFELQMAINRNVLLKHLSLFKCNLEEEGLLHITKALLNISTLQYLNLSNNNTDIDTVGANTELIVSRNSGLQLCNYSGSQYSNSVSNDGLEDVVDFLI